MKQNQNRKLPLALVLAMLALGAIVLVANTGMPQGADKTVALQKQAAYISGEEAKTPQVNPASVNDENEAGDSVVGLAPFYRYWNSVAGDHFYTMNWHEIGTRTPGHVGRFGYRSEGVACFIAARQYEHLVPLYRYYQGHSRDHFYTTHAHEIGTTTPGHTGRFGYKSEGVAGYCSKIRLAGSVPFYRYWNPHNTDHFYTTNWLELGHGRHGWRYEGIQCFVWKTHFAHLVMEEEKPLAETHFHLGDTPEEEPAPEEKEVAEDAFDF